MPARGSQLTLGLLPTNGWGGRREGAGRKPRGERAGVPHARVLKVRSWTPVHVTLRVREHAWNLRSLRSWRVLRRALEGVRGREGFSVVHVSVQGNHVHGLVEAASPAALAGGMRALSGRLALGLNAMMGRKGPVFADRYHAHVLRTPAEVRNALAYVLGNFASHAARRGEPLTASRPDPFSSAAPLGPDGRPWPVVPARSWLARTAARTSAESSHDP